MIKKLIFNNHNTEYYIKQHIQIMKRVLEDKYRDINNLISEYYEKKKKLKVDYQEKVDTTFKQITDIVDEDREKHIKIVKDWMKDYIDNDQGKVDCKKRHWNKDADFGYGFCRGYHNWHITVDDEDFKYRTCEIIVPSYIKRLANALGIRFCATYYISTSMSDMYGDKEISVYLGDTGYSKLD